MRLLARRSAAVVALAMATAMALPAQAANAPFRALFIGNSYIYVNDLPMVVGDLAAAAHAPRAFEPWVVLVGGSTLEAHIERKMVFDEIAKGHWDVVVLQEQSMRPIDKPDAMLRDMRTLADAAHKVGAKVVLYETWAREATPETQDSLTHVYHNVAKAIGADVAHVGEAWAAFRKQEGAIPQGAHSALFLDDGSHPTPTGTYIAGTVMYSTFYGKSPIGLPGVTRTIRDGPPPGPAPDAPRDSVPAAIAKRIQELAWMAVQHP